MPDARERLQSLAVRLKARRQALGRSANSVASAAGITQAYLWILENPSNKRAARPSVEVLTKLLQTLTFSRADVTELFSLVGYDPSSVLQGSSEKLGAEELVQSERIGRDIPKDQWMLVPPERLVGRESDLEWLKRRLQHRSGTVTALTGMSGIGKTALAASVLRELQVQSDFPGGIAVVACQGLTDAWEVLRRVLQRFDRRGEFDDQFAWPELAARVIGGERTLVVLDDLEPNLNMHDVVRTLAATGASILLTSRQAVMSSVVGTGAASRNIDLLEENNAIELFAVAYGYLAANELSKEEFGAAQRIVKSLGNHTLAIRLAGAYAADARRDLEALARDLADPLHALTVLSGESPDPVGGLFSKSLEALPQNSLKLLQILACISVPPKGISVGPNRIISDISRNAAYRIADELGFSQTSVNTLILRGILDAYVNSDLPYGCDRERIRLHSLLAAFAQRYLGLPASGELETAQLAYAAYYRDYVMKLRQLQEVPREQRHVALEVDEANIVGALEWARDHDADEIVASICLGMRHYWLDRDLISFSLRFLPSGLRAADIRIQNDPSPDNYKMKARIALAYGTALLTTGDHDKAQTLFTLGCEIWRSQGDEAGAGTVPYAFGLLARARGQLEEAGILFKESLRLRKAGSNRAGEAADSSALARTVLQAGHVTEAEDFGRRALAIAQETGDRQEEGIARLHLGQVALARGRFDEAERHLMSGRDLLAEVKDRSGTSAAHSQLARVALERAHATSDPDTRESYIVRAENETLASQEIAEGVQDEWIVNVNIIQFGRIALERRELDEAERLFTQAFERSIEAGHRWNYGASVALLGQVAFQRALRGVDDADKYFQLDIAQRNYKRALEVAEELGNRRAAGVDHVQLGRIAHLQGHTNEAESEMRRGLTLLRDLNDVTNFAEGALAFGAFLLETDRARQDDCEFLRIAVNMYANMNSDITERGSELLKKLDASGTHDPTQTIRRGDAQGLDLHQ